MEKQDEKTKKKKKPPKTDTFEMELNVNFFFYGNDKMPKQKWQAHMENKMKKV